MPARVFTLALSLLLATQARAALQPLADAELAAQNGAGLALILEDFRYQGAPGSYLELIGGPSPSGSAFKRGDVRYYGLTMSSWNGGAYWDDSSACSGDTAIAGDLGCPMSLAGVGQFAPHDNPYVIRVFDYTAPGWNGSAVATGQNRTVLELLGPSNMHSYRWGFWGEIEVNKGGACPGGTTGTPGCALQSQTLVWGKPTAPGNPASIVSDLKFDAAGQKAAGYTGTYWRVFQNSASADNTFALFYHSRLSGDFRFAVNKQNIGSEAIGTVPRFSLTEGLYFRNVAAYLPFGQLHYQAIIFDDVPAAAGNFVIELTRLPNATAAYDDFYSLGGDGLNNDADIGYNRSGRPARYYETHGYSLWGRAGTTNNNDATLANRYLDTSDGIYFYKGDSAATFTATAQRPGINTSCSTGNTGAGCNPPASPAYTTPAINRVNIGDARIEGLLINHLKATTCSAGPTSPC